MKIQVPLSRWWRRPVQVRQEAAFALLVLKASCGLIEFLWELKV